MTRPVIALGVLFSLLTAALPAAASRAGNDKLDLVLRRRAEAPRGTARVIVRATDVDAVETLVARLRGRIGRRLTGIGAVAVEVPDTALTALAADDSVQSVSSDRRIEGTLERTGLTIGSRWVNENLGIDGTGIGVAIIDSGVTRSHDDLSGNRIVQFVDFVDYQSTPHDGYGHGTHVAGIIAGNGFDSDGARKGIAPGAHLIVLKALDERGDGFISSAIAAIDYAIDQRAVYNIRIINLSVAAGVYESYKTDPLALAARRAVDAGIVVVTAAGNLGRGANGQVQFSGITSPGNAPWVLTVGATSHNGTSDRGDDKLAPFSSVGPSAIDQVAKPDLVAPGVGIQSLADAGSTLFNTRAAARLWGTVPTATQPYLSLSGTSMAAPVVAATVALMLQANPALSPTGVKTVLRATAEPHRDYSAAAQGAGFLDARAAVEMARTLVEHADAVAAINEAVEYDGDLASAPTVCDAADANCTDYASAFGADAGTVVGLTAAPAETVVWAPPADRPAKRRQPGARRRFRKNSASRESLT